MDERQRRIQQRRTRRRRNELIMKCIIALLLIVVIALGAVLIKELVSGSKKNTQGRGTSGAGEIVIAQGTAGNAEEGQHEDGSPGGTVSGAASELIAQADLLAAQYDYDGAIQLLKASIGYVSNTQMQNAVAGYEQTKTTCVSYPVDQVTHVFFSHTGER